MNIPPSVAAAARRFLIIGACGLARLLHGQTASLNLMPMPMHVAISEGRLVIGGSFRVATPHWTDRRLQAAITRALHASAPDASNANLIVDCQSAGPELPTLGEDESYQLDVSSQHAVLRSQTVVGALRGLATIQQLAERTDLGWQLPIASIQDQPRFLWRGLLIDVSRRWKGVETIQRELDGMALVKLNVLHFHLTDDQGFRIECKSHPELTAQGADGQFFTQEQMRGLIAYAADRGIRIVPEFDLPGHATSWLVSHPELASAPGPFLLERHWGVFDPVMDPTNEATYKLLSDVFTEMAALFPDPYLHIGGDENNGKEWSANPRLQRFIRDHHLGDNPGLQAYFNQRAGTILAGLHKRMIGWDEILHPDLPRGDVIESWRGAKSLGEAARMGFEGILANGYYLDHCKPAAEYYEADPLPAGSKLTADEQKRVLGGEASMWGEWVDEETIDSRIWPSAAAVAERLWSPETVRDPNDMYRRLDAVSRSLTAAGIRQESYVGPGVERLLGKQEASVDNKATVRVFVDVLEPAKVYGRGKLQVNSDQWTPLLSVVDLARPDGATARLFSNEVSGWLVLAERAEATASSVRGAGTAEVDHGSRAPSEQPVQAEPASPAAGSIRDHDTAFDSAGNAVAAAGAIRDHLRAFHSSGDAVAHKLALRSPALAPAGPLAMQLADAAEVGLQALGVLDHSSASDAIDKVLALARLKADSEPHDGADLAIIEPIRQLVMAAAAANK